MRERGLTRYINGEGLGAGEGDEMARWHHRLNGSEFEWTPGVGDGPGGLACCDSWGRKESDTPERLNGTELNWTRRLLASGCYVHSAGLAAQPCLALCDPMVCPWNSIARTLEWVAIPLSRGSSQLKDWTQVSCITSRLFTIWATRKEVVSHIIIWQSHENKWQPDILTMNKAEILLKSEILCLLFSSCFVLF